MRVVIAGASGFIGTHLAEAFRADGDDVLTIGRTEGDARWDDDAGLREVLEGADVLINLAGRSVDCRYHGRNRAEIIRSRVSTTATLARAVGDLEAPPALWINAATATIYRDAMDRPMTESTGERGSGFSVDVARLWEEVLFAADLPRTRRVAMRISIVLGPGGALGPLAMLARLGLGGPQLDGWWFPSRRRRAAGTWHEGQRTRGRQKFSWVHIDDVYGIVRFLADRPELEGPVNVTSPNPVDNRTFMATLRRAVGMPVGVPAFRWMLELGAIALRTESELLLKSRWVLPERLLAAGYDFREPELEPALRSALTR